jgi:predicted ester cyclase
MIAAPPGLEPAIKFDGRNLSPQKETVRRFYKDMWDHADVGLIPELLHSDFTFRGSLGPVLVGHSQFEDYVRWVTDSLEDYTSDILDLVEENNRVSGKLRFHGIHRKSLFGQPPTGQHVWWYGAPIFVFRDGKIEDLWVLGDINGLIGRLDHSTNAPPEFNSEYASSQAELRDRDRGLIMSAPERPSEAAAAHHQSQLGFATRAIHHAYNPAEHHGAASHPIYLTSTYAFPSVADNDAAAALGGKLYAREHNPTTELLEARLANLDGAEAGLVLASGMAAAGALTLSLLSQGDELIVHRTLYSNTTTMTEQGLPRFGITAVPVDLHDPTNLDAVVTSRSRAVYFETPVNPTGDVLDIADIAARAGRAGLLVLVDGTFASPALQRPLQHGADIVLHSLTKYINGHGDLLGGALLGRAELIAKIHGQGLRFMTGAALTRRQGRRSVNPGFGPCASYYRPPTYRPWPCDLRLPIINVCPRFAAPAG